MVATSMAIPAFGQNGIKGIGFQIFLGKTCGYGKTPFLRAPLKMGWEVLFYCATIYSY